MYKRQSKSTTVFLGLILLFNFLDFMTVIFYGQLENGSIERMFILENLLSVAIAYSLVCMERDYAGEKRRNWVSVFFPVSYTHLDVYKRQRQRWTDFR